MSYEAPHDVYRDEDEDAEFMATWEERRAHRLKEIKEGKRTPPLTDAEKRGTI